MGIIFLYYCCARRCLKPLKIRTHNPLQWDERYEPFIHRVGFLPLARLVNRNLPLMDTAALTALVHRWCPWTHTFHRPSGEIMVTLQDITMILGLPIDDTPICVTVSSTEWSDSVGQAIGLQLPDVAGGSEGQEDNKRALWVAHNSVQHLLGGCRGHRRSTVCLVLC
jgi:hypothetical protein